MSIYYLCAQDPEKAQRVIKAMPNWVPGKQNGKVVNVHYAVPIKFLLN